MFWQWEGFKMEEYIKVLLEQIRCKKAHAAIREELCTHMEEQTADNMAAGMSREEAEAAAVKDMGSPVETGISLDRIHRPQMAWGILGLMAVITLLANVLMHSRAFTGYSCIGFVLMVLVYRLDYTFVGRFSKIIAAAFLLLGFAYVWVEPAVNLYQILFSAMMLYVPVYAAVVYKYHGTGYSGIIKSVLWLAAPVFLALCLPNRPLAVILFMSMLVVLTLAIQKGWFSVERKKATALLWAVMLGIPVPALFVFLRFGMREYQYERIMAWITKSGDGAYQMQAIRRYLDGSTWVGKSAEYQDIVNSLPDWDSGFSLTYFTASYGKIVGIGVCALLLVLVCAAFLACTRQKNQLGMLMGVASAMILAVNTSVNLLENAGVLPITQTFLPFFSAGGSPILVSYILIGIILSVYRYRNVYAAHANVKLPSFKMTIDL